MHRSLSVPRRRLVAHSSRLQPGSLGLFRIAARDGRHRHFASTGNRNPANRFYLTSTPPPAARPWAGASGFRDFPGLPVTKENRSVSHRTLPRFYRNPRMARALV